MGEIDPQSGTWREVKRWAEERISAHQERLEVSGLPPADTEHARGAIAALRELVALPEPPKGTFPAESVGYTD